MAGTDDWADRCHLSGGIFPGEIGRFCDVTALMHFHSSVLCYMSGTIATAVQQDEDVPAASEPEGSSAPGPSSSPVHPPRTPPLPAPPLPDIPLVGTPLVGFPFSKFLAISTQKKWDCSSSGSLDNHHNKRTCVNSQEVKASSEHSSAQGNEDMPKLIPETGTSFE